MANYRLTKQATKQLKKLKKSDINTARRIKSAIILLNDNNGQFFTPPEISLMMAQMTYGDQLKDIDQPFVTLSEPACGAGGMVLAFAKVMMGYGHNPTNKLWVQCIDVDRLAALMSYRSLAYIMATDSDF